MMTLEIISLLIAVIQGIILFALIYHYFLLAVSVPRIRYSESRLEKQHRFALVIPAHNEAAVISQTVMRLREIAYPRQLFDVIVVADHCHDDTALQVRQSGGICYERNEGESGRKGYALAWLLERVLAGDPVYDAVVVFDADSCVCPNFLAVMNQGLNNGFAVLQGQHFISNPKDTVFNRLAAIDMRINNRLRNAARHNLSFSCRLMGDAMCFSREVLQKCPWGTFSLVEDIEYGIHLMRSGARIGYSPEAVSYGQAAGGWRQAERQRMRWEGGMLDIRRRLGLRLLLESAKNRRLALLDRGIELLLPPFSILFVLSVGLLTLTGLWAGVPWWLPFEAMALIVIAWAVFPFLALAVDRAPLSLFLAMASSPIYLTWRLWVRLLAIRRGGRVQWVRTPRREEG
jgi:cellulose synthase/poly-beta-1,6-N-acetylglucosamine synthase-like glycosyltransferase